MRIKLLFGLFFFLCVASLWAQQDDASLLRLKVAAARQAGLDTTAAFQDSMCRYRQKLSLVHLLEPATVKSKACLTLRREFQIRQIYKHLPQVVTSGSLRAAEAQMDSIHQLLQQGKDFEALLQAYSDDKTVRWISSLTIPAEQEDIIGQLGKGEYSSPFYTPLGLHIVQVLDVCDRQIEPDLMEDVCQYPAYLMEDSVTRPLLVYYKEKLRYQPNQQALSELRLRGRTTQTLFTVNGKAYTGQDFARFAAVYPARLSRQINDYITMSVLREAACGVEGMEAFQQECSRYRDQLLASEIYRIQVLEPSEKDNAGLMAYFDAHRKDYHWQVPKFKGAVIHAATKKAAKRVRKMVKKLPEGGWEQTLSQEKDIEVETGIFSIGDNTFVDEKVYKGPKALPKDGYPYSEVCGKKLKGPDNYMEVLPQLKKDYQAFLVGKWLDGLRQSTNISE